MTEWKVGDWVQDPEGITYVISEIFPSDNVVLIDLNNRMYHYYASERGAFTLLKEPSMQIPKLGDTIHLQGVISASDGKIIGFDLLSGERLYISNDPQNYTITPRAPQVGDMVYLRWAGEILYEVLAIRNGDVALWNPNRKTMLAVYLDNISTTYQGA